MILPLSIVSTLIGGMTDKKNELLAKVEAILFVAGEPIKFKKIADALGQEISAVKESVISLAEDFKNEKRGLRIVVADDAAQMVTAPEFSELIEELLKGELKDELTPASLETLAIIAYKGPIKRADIDFIRGVNSTYTIRNLLLRGLIEREGAESDGRAYEYRISFEFLRHLGLEKPEDLPDYEKISSSIKLAGGNLQSEENKLE